MITNVYIIYAFVTNLYYLCWSEQVVFVTEVISLVIKSFAWLNKYKIISVEAKQEWDYSLREIICIRKSLCVKMLSKWTLLKI